MKTIADIGAAVIGTGFIGTVHVEALRRIGVQVRGVLGQQPGARPGTGRRRSACRRAYDSLEDLLDDTTVDVVHVTSPNDLHVSQARDALAAGKHVVCEKPLAMTADESAELVRLAAASGLVNATNFNIRYYPLNQHAHEIIAGGGLGDVRLVTGRYFQDWLLLESDWNWRLQPDRGGALRAVGDIGSHWLDLMTFVTGQHVSRGHGRALDLHRHAPGADGPGRDLLDGALRRHASSVRSPPRTPPRSCSASTAAPAARSASARSARAGRTRSSTRSTAPTAPGPGTPSSRTRPGSATAIAPTRSSSATRR